MITPTALQSRFMSLSAISLCIALAACGGGADEPAGITAEPASVESLDTSSAAGVTKIAAISSVSTNRVQSGSTVTAVKVASSSTTTGSVVNGSASVSTSFTPAPVLIAADTPDPAGTAPSSRQTLPALAPPGALPSMPPNDEPPQPSGIVLDGSGVPGVYAPGCTPKQFDDFMDTLTWNVRRVEPRDCAIVKDSTPVFAWKQPFDIDLSAAYTFELRTASGSLVTSRNTFTPRLFIPDSPLAVGNYTWKVTYRNKKGEAITSASRRFNVPTASVGITLPSGVTIANLATSKAHPRTLPTGATFPYVASAALEGEYNASFNAYMKAAATYRVEVPPAPPANLTRADFSSDLEFNNWKLQLARTAEREHKAIETLSYAARFSGDSEYATAAVARLVSLAAWPTRGATSETAQDQANREIYVGLSVGLDLLHGSLTPAQTSQVVSALKDRVQQAYVKLPSFDASPYQSALPNSVKYIVVALLHSAGASGFPEAKDWLRTAWDTWVTTATTWSADGGFVDSVAYSWWAGISLVETAATVRLVTGVDLSRWTAISQFGNNMIALVAPAIDLPLPFGDGAETTTLYQANSWNMMRLNAAVSRTPANEWYWRAAPANATLAQPLTALHYMLLGLKLPAVVPEAPLANSWVFEDTGLVALHSSTSDPNRTSLFFRSSRIGSANHSTADNNAFVFVSKGKALFISGGYYPYFKSPHHALVGRATRFKNALTFDGGVGQAEPSSTPTSPGEPMFSMDARGRLINFYDSGVWAVTSGDATLAYSGYDSAAHAWKPLLNNAVRTVAFNRSERVAVIYDWATSATPRTWEINLQMLNSPGLSGTTLRATNGSAQACVDVYGLPGAFKITKGFPIAPENGLPDEYQARYSASRASTQLAAVTVIREDCRSMPVTVNFSGTSVSVAINGTAPLVMEKRAVTVP